MTVQYHINEDGEQMLIANALEYRAVNIAQAEGYKKMLAREANTERLRGKNFVVCYHEPIKEIMFRLELHELGGLLLLLPYLKFKGGGMLIKDNEPLGMKQIEEIIGRSRASTSRIIKRLVDEGLLIKGGSTKKPTFIIHNLCHTMGEVHEGMMFTKLYQVAIKNSTKELSLQEAGILYKILPWFHFDSYYLCSNPDEHNPNEILHMSHQELANHIGEDEKTVYTYLKSLMLKGFIMKLSGHGVVNYKVNPDVMFRQSKESANTDLARQEFAELRRTNERQQMQAEFGL